MTNSNLTSSTVKDNMDGITGQLKGLVESGQDKLVEMKDKLVGAKDVVVEKSESMLTMMSKTIKAHPFTAVGLAIGATAGIVYLVTRLTR